MTEQELREKIVKIALNTSWTDMFGDHYSIGESAANAIADALIAAGIGDVSKLQRECNSKEEAYNKCYFDYKHWKHEAKEYKHRAEVLRLALSKSVLDENAIFDDDVCRYILSNTKLTEEYYIEQAEKELAEDGKE